jgi:hypothetical protein
VADCTNASLTAQAYSTGKLNNQFYYPTTNYSDGTITLNRCYSECKTAHRALEQANSHTCVDKCDSNGTYKFRSNQVFAGSALARDSCSTACKVDFIGPNGQRYFYEDASEFVCTTKCNRIVLPNAGGEVTSGNATLYSMKYEKSSDRTEGS